MLLKLDIQIVGSVGSVWSAKFVPHFCAQLNTTNRFAVCISAGLWPTIHGLSYKHLHKNSWIDSLHFWVQYLKIITISTQCLFAYDLTIFWLTILSWLTQTLKIGDKCKRIITKNRNKLTKKNRNSTEQHCRAAALIKSYIYMQ